jgi:hypothetical protein
MRRGIWAAMVTLAWLWLSGCAATGPKASEMTTSLNTVPAGYGRIVFFRSGSMMGAAIQPDIRLDGQVVGQSKPGGFFYVDASPGRHVAAVSTEATSSVEVQVVSGQTHYVRSAMGFGLVVGRVLLSVEGMITAKGELSSLSYTGTNAPRIGSNSDGTAATAPATQPIVVSSFPPLKRGDQVVYRVTDGYTGVAREAVYTVDRIEAERVLFNQGTRVEGLDGTVAAISVPLAGDMDNCSPPGGWGPLDMQLGMRWNVQFAKQGALGCAGDFDLQAQMVSDEPAPTPFGMLRLQRIDYKGTGIRSRMSAATLYLDARVWYSPALKRVVRFESELQARAGTNTPASREKVELVVIRRD